MWLFVSSTTYGACTHATPTNPVAEIEARFVCSASNCGLANRSAGRELGEGDGNSRSNILIQRRNEIGQGELSKKAVLVCAFQLV